MELSFAPKMKNKNMSKTKYGEKRQSELFLAFAL